MPDLNVKKMLITGLGNPGAEYAGTRHNIGFDVVTAFVEKTGGSFAPDRLADVARVKIKGVQFICIRPTTFMNLSGKAVNYWLKKEHIPAENSLTILDDIALPPGKLRLRKSGSSGGHNGLKDIEATLGTDAYPRLRFGAGGDFPKGRQAEFVLGTWLPTELPVVQLNIGRCVEVIEKIPFIGIERVMNEVNKK